MIKKGRRGFYLEDNAVKYGIGEAVLDHYEKYLGVAMARKVFEQSSDEPGLQILAYGKVFPQCIVFASLGFSRYSSIVGRCCECIMATDDGFDVAPSILANALFYIVQSRIEFGWGMSFGIDRLAPRFSVKFGKDAIYFTRPHANLPVEFNLIKNAEMDIDIFMAFFISSRENEYFKENGAELFEALLERGGVDVFDLKRECILSH